MLVESRMMTLLSQLLLVSSLLLSFVENGRAGITSSYVRSEFPAVDIPLDDPVMAIPRGYNAPQQVRITQGDYDGKAVIITWVTMDEPGRSLVRYGKTERCRLRSRGKASNYTFYEYQSGYIHQCLVDNLEYDTKYYYKLGNGRSERTFSFRTPPAVGPDTPYTFGIIGDLGQTFNSLSTLEHYAQSNGQAVLFLGDISYADQYKYNDIGVRWDSWGRFAEQSTAYQPWLWSVGNHEIEFMTSLGETVSFKTYLHRFPTPYAASQSTDPLYYAVRRASAHIIVLNSYSAFAPFTPQWFWLLQEFQRVDREQTPWLIVIMHKPIYNSNDAHYMEGEGMRVTFESWFVQNKVDMVLAGHVHAYERTHRISNIRYNVTYGYPYPVPDKSAPVYLTIGDGGNKEGLASKFRDPQPHFSAFREASYGHSTLEIKNRTHAIYSWHRNDNGNKVTADSFVFLNQRWASNLDRKYETRILPDIATT